MLDRHRASQDRDNAELSPEARKAPASRPMSDCEVPLPRATSASIGDIPAVVHQWLDGDVSERTARSADATAVALWNRIGAEMSQRRRQEPPAKMSDHIMAALPNEPNGQMAKKPKQRAKRLNSHARGPKGLKAE